MEVERLALAGLVRLVPPRLGDERGFFSETFNAARFRQAAGTDTVFVQDNQSLSRQAGVLRGLHGQRAPFAQAKLVRVTRGRIFDVAVDVRRASPTYGRWAATELSAENWAQLFIPAGFLHGFYTLEPETEVQYKVDAHYAADHEIGVVWNDPELGIAWPLEGGSPLLSDKDRGLPTFADFNASFA
ncbi:dTDP-4-dehydrorhamnose 3,5-epimerase [Labrys monachus]|uniref:dTDP-4-dehydrorhamnose 3,5-epimerase n=1 Tax=Labrys monachus TaxID=217067 RepID=A0ABU0FC44_9HYPH|nr:dTDP-4-dehydrorhamnose 3,5-epimerase [Labrys monachus]MDQ0392170.1 dTDP-4-dehydrorhamnose 3,5-epimerase [Labrys monachus]